MQDAEHVGAAQHGRGRAKRGSITRAQVVEAALRAIESGGYEAMTIRSLSSDLGVAPMSLYRHVSNRDDLLSAVVERLLEGRWRPRTPHDNWREWTIEAADRLRKLLIRYPAALHTYLRHPVTSPTALKRMREMLDVLETAGLDARQSLDAYATIHMYTIGFAAVEAGRSATLEPPMIGVEDELERHLHVLTSSRQFRIGLEQILNGCIRQNSRR